MWKTLDKFYAIRVMLFTSAVHALTTTHHKAFRRIVLQNTKQINNLAVFGSLLKHKRKRTGFRGERDYKYGINLQNHISGSMSVCFLTSNQISNAPKADEFHTTSSTAALTSEEREERIAALHLKLQDVDINGDDMADALRRSLTTMEGFDPKYGKSAIKAYKTFIEPRPSKIDAVRAEDAEIAASRCARQIDFLIKRHKSHETEWIRHTDKRGSDSDEDNAGDTTSMKKDIKRFPLIILLDNVRSAFNVGSIFRTADACGCSHVYTTGITPSPNGRGKEKLAKSALGADIVVPSKHFSTTREAVNYIRTNLKGWTIIGMETTAHSKCYTDIEYPGSGLFVENKNELELQGGVVIVLGNEVTGVDTEIMSLLDMIVEIPMYGTKNSLNIAACAPVVLYEIIRQWKTKEEIEIT